MKISKVIKLLTSQKKEYGDIDIYVNGFDEVTDSAIFEINQIDRFSTKDGKRILIITAMEKVGE